MDGECGGGVRVCSVVLCVSYVCKGELCPCGVCSMYGCISVLCMWWYASVYIICMPVHGVLGEGKLYVYRYVMWHAYV